MTQQDPTGSKRLAKALKVMATPGVKLKVKPGTPLYWIDPHNVDMILRRFQGSDLVERGRLVDGQFVVIPDET